MAESQQITESQQIIFSYQKLAEILIKEQGIHHGIWGVYAEFAIGAANVAPTPDADSVPAAIVPLQKFGIQRFTEEVQGLTVDAALINPALEAPSQTSGEETHG
jgi:hypothetical protein